MNGNIFIRGLLVIAGVWLCVWLISGWMGGLKASPQRVERMIEEAEFDDWSHGEGSGEEAKHRKGELERISEVFASRFGHQPESIRTSAADGALATKG